MLSCNFLVESARNVDMTTFEIIKKLAKKHDKSLQQVAIDLRFSSNLFYRWKTSEPKARDLEKVADYFGVSVDYLLNRKTSSKTDMTIEEALDSVMSYDGKPITDNDREVLRGIIEGYLNTKKG